MVEVSSTSGSTGIDRGALERDGEQILRALGFSLAELSVVLCDDAFIRPLNREWRNKDKATDVLSFPQEDALAPGRFATPPAVLGDVIISTETAQRQAAELGHDLSVEIRALLVHGVLHLVGYDHEDPEDEGRMRAEEVRVLDLIGVERAAALVERAG